MTACDVEQALRDDGVVVLRTAFSPDDYAFLRDPVWCHIEATTTVRRSDADTWSFAGNFAMRAVEQRSIWSAVRSSPAVLAALDTIFGVRRWAPPGPPQVLLSFPAAERWEMPGGWRLLAGRGGREVLDAPTDAHGVHIRPVEIPGEPGDVVLTHVHVFHSPAPNTGTLPRQMLGNAVRRRPS